jgi:hypothetical protein
LRTILGFTLVNCEWFANTIRLISGSLGRNSNGLWLSNWIRTEESQTISNFNGNTILYPWYEPETSRIAASNLNNCIIRSRIMPHNWQWKWYIECIGRFTHSVIHSVTLQSWFADWRVKKSCHNDYADNVRALWSESTSLETDWNYIRWYMCLDRIPSISFSEINYFVNLL